MPINGDGPRPSWIPGHARRHQRTAELDARWMPACQCGWAFYASVRSLRIADRTHGFHLDRVHLAAPPAPRPEHGSAVLAAATAVPTGSPGPRDGGGRSDTVG